MNITQVSFLLLVIAFTEIPSVYVANLCSSKYCVLKEKPSKEKKSISKIIDTQDNSHNKSSNRMMI